MSNPRYRYRDAKSGSYVSEEYAKANPDTTVREDDTRVARLEAQVASLQSTVSCLAEQVRSLSEPKIRVSTLEGDSDVPREGQ